MKLISWNVNGIRSVLKKGFLEVVREYTPDILCVQETRALKDQLPKDLILENYYSYFSKSKIKGYSGVCIYSKVKPIAVNLLGKEIFDNEGRGLIAYYDNFVLINGYFPNSQALRRRLVYKLDFLSYVENLMDSFVNGGKNVVICGDFNIAHTEIDLINPDSNRDSPGYYIEETTWLDSFLNKGYVDTFRIFNKEPGCYTWWSYRTRARERNMGWRIDYFVVNEFFKRNVKKSLILDKVMGSDHCPVFLELSDVVS
ncbi:exodeoxyribonuclease-3 [Borreliella japonica]|uniref:Exodeoxyribonuclease-3 n=1 Tax=Borreliella japonica TaxID=34095 RepID=A0A1G4P7P3_BORJA|nr:exodeoxyribonuclease III [Borreliella japonica]WKC89126.1 exodeoxyribonuclease III [Borreliella japonica]SCW28221.1 exodeoxyribonuclease-3 [Borreliella japonica]